MPLTTDFQKLKRNIRKEYLGEDVPLKYRNKYGKKYDLSETNSIAYAIAKSKGIKIHKIK